MDPRIHGQSLLALVALVALAVSGCSGEAGSGEPAESSGGTIELAVSETCAEGSTPRCVSIGDQYVMSPSTFESAGIEDAGVAENGGQSAVDLTFTDDGADVLKSLTQEAARAGAEARLVMKVGDEMRSAVAVPAPVTGGAISIPQMSVDSAQEVLDLILND